MNEIPWQLLAEASITYADSQRIDFDLSGGVRSCFAPKGGLTPPDYKFFGVEPPDDDPPSPAIDCWYHERGEQVPQSFPWGPLQGSQERLAAWLYSGQRGRRKPDARPLHGKAKSGKTIWLRKIHRTLYEVWFRHEAEYTHAAQNAVPPKALTPS